MECAAYRGRIVKSTGDGLLVEFPSVVDAFRCAVTIQLAMPEREAHVFEDQRIAYRIGINIGDIVIDDDDIYGDGVNIASRLEALAEAGGICVSRIVFDQLNGKVNSGFEYRGAQKVKNIVEPIRVYQAKLRPEAPPAAPAKSVRKPVQKRASLIAALLRLDRSRTGTSGRPRLRRIRLHWLQNRYRTGRRSPYCHSTISAATRSRITSATACLRT